MSPANIAIERPEDLFSLKGRTALIVGGATGIGGASSRLFAERGAHVIVLDIDLANAEETVADIQGQGGSAEVYALDVTDKPSLEDFFGWLAAHHDAIDVYFNHAGMPGPPHLEFDHATWKAMMRINVWVPMVMTQRLLPHLRRSESASVIYTASIAGLKAVPFLPAYAGSKAALVQFMKSAAVLLASEGIRVNALCPGATDTPALRRDIEMGLVDGVVEEMGAKLPMGRLGYPDDMAAAALFLASDASRFMTGVALAVDGGSTL